MNKESTNEIPLVYNMGEAAKFIGISRKTVYNRIIAGEFPAPYIQFYTKATGKLENAEGGKLNHNKYWTKEQLTKVKSTVARHRSAGVKK